MVECSLPSGALLRIDEAPFEDAYELHSAILEELRSVSFSMNVEISALMKEAVCAVIPSKKIRALVEKCMLRSLYDGARITADFWKSGKGKREDYIPACVAVAQENIRPFVKSLFSEYSKIVLMITENPGLKSENQP